MNSGYRPSGVDLARQLLESMLGRLSAESADKPLIGELAGYCAAAIEALDTNTLEHGIGAKRNKAQQALLSVQQATPAQQEVNSENSTLQEELNQLRQAQQNLQARYDQLGFLVSAAKMMLYVARPEGDYAITYVSDNVRDMFGYEPQQWIGNSDFWRERLHPEDIASHPQKFGELFAKGDAQHEYRFRHADGGYRWLLTESRLLRDADGRPERILGCAIDVTERKKTELALQESEQRFVSFMNNLPGLAFIKDGDGRYLFLSESARNLSGRQPELVVGKTDDELYPPELAARYRRLDKEVLETGKPLSVLDTSVDYGQLRTWQINRFPLPDATGRVTMMAGIAIDISEQTRAERALQDSLQLYRTLADAMPMGLYRLDHEGQILFLNKFMVAKLGSPPESEYLGRPIYDVGPQEDLRGVAHARSEDRRVLQSGISTTQIEGFGRRRSGEKFLWEITRIPVRDGNGAIIGLQGVIRDITKQQRAEAALTHERQLLHNLMDNIPALIAFKGRDLRYTRINLALAKVWGLASPNDAIGRPSRDFVSEQRAREFDQQEHEILRTGISVENSEIKLTVAGRGTVWYLRSQVPIRDASGVISGLIAISHDITERKLAELALRQSEQRFTTFMKHMPGVASIRAADGRYVYLGGNAPDMVNRSQDAIGKTADELFPPDIANQLKAHHQEIIETGRPLSVVETIVGSGEPEYWLSNCFPLPDAEGRITMTAAISINITERKLAELALKQSEQRFATFMKHMPGVASIRGTDGRYVFFSGSQLHRRSEDLVGKTPDEVHPPAIAEQLKSHHKEVLETGRQLSIVETVIEREGTEYWLSNYFPLPDAEGRITMTAAISIDITEQKRAEQALQFSKQELRDILDSMYDVIWSATPGTYAPTYVSAAAERVFGYSPEAIMADISLWRSLIHPDDQARVLARLRGYKNGAGWDQEYRIIRADGEIRVIRNRGHVVRAENGDSIRLDGIITDITELKKAQDELKAGAERIKRLAMYMVNMREEQSAAIAREVHDELGGILTVLKLGLASVARKASDPKQLSEHLDSMVALTQTAIMTVKKISSSLHPTLLDTLGLVAAIKSHVVGFSRLTGIAVATQLPRRLDLTPARSIAVFRIIQEALTNVARHADATQVNIVLRKQRRELLLELRDNGKGMENCELGQLDGHGIPGMQERSLSMGGELKIQSAAGTGTTLVLRMPLIATSKGS